MNPIGTSRNRYFDNTKNHTIFTPPPLCNWLKEILEPELSKIEFIFDPAVGSGNLLHPFKGKTLLGCDIEDFQPNINQFWQDDFLTWRGNFPTMDLVIMNPPYNHTKETRKKWGRSSLLPELFAAKCFELWGKDLKLIMFTPMGFRLNTRCSTRKQGDRYRNIRDKFGSITSIVTLPLDVFPNPDFDPEKDEVRRNPKKKIYASNIKRKETQQEIIFFNMPKLEPHYLLPDKVINELRIMDMEAWR